MPLVNHTPYPALAFEGVDPLSQRFHVLVMRQTLTWGAEGRLFAADEQRPLCEQDQQVQAPNGAAVTMQESDLCHFKPRADVIVNATAHAPGRLPVPAFDVRLLVRHPDADAPAIDKRLHVVGPRQFVRQQRVLSTAPRWTLSAPAPFASLPLTLAEAWGGQSPDRDGRVQACRDNPAGCGWWDQNMLQRPPPDWMAAPRIEWPAQPIGAGFVEHPALASGPVGLGVRPKRHPARAALAGSVDEAFARSDRALPADFDFAVWNAAWPDQQLDALRGDEWIGLVNLCPADVPAAAVSPSGDTLLGLALPGTLPFVLVRWADGRIGELALALDTLIVEPEALRVSCVWRAVLPLAPVVRVFELREMDADAVAAARAERARGESTERGLLADKLGARKDAAFKAVSTAPSFNKTPVGSATPPLPYPVTQDLSISQGTVADVRLNGDPAYVLDDSTQPTCIGDAAGSVGGVKSGTVGGKVEPTKGSGTVRIGGKPAIREGDPCTLNNGNCPGVYVTTPALPTGKAGEAQVNSNPPVQPQTAAEAGWWGKASPWVHGALGVASFIPGVSLVAGGVDAAIYAAEGNLVEAGLSAAAMIPGGKVATTAGKAVKGMAAVAKGTDKAADAGRSSRVLMRQPTLARRANSARRQSRRARASRRSPVATKVTGSRSPRASPRRSANAANGWPRWT